MTKVTGQVWIIRHKETKELWTAVSGKSSWSKQGAAKNAWANSYERRHGYSYSMHKNEKDKHLFKNQDEYEVHETTSSLRATDKNLSLLIKELRALDERDCNVFSESWESAEAGFQNALDQMNYIIDTFMGD